MSEFSDRVIAAGLRRLRGENSTPPGFDKRLRDEIVERRLARFHEWPSGHWSITDRGYSFLAEQTE